MKETELKLHPCYCGGEMRIEKVSQDGGMDGMFWNWKLTCSKCGLTKTYAADGFYGRKYKTFEEVVDDWNWRKQKELCEDAISRQDALNCLTATGLKKFDFILDARNKIKNLPSVTPQQKAGKWIEGKYRDDDIRYNDSSYKCNKCGRIVDFKENYCPNCGAKMEVEK